MEEKELDTIPQSEVDEWFEDPAMKEWIEELETNFKFNNHTQGDLIEYEPGGVETIMYQVPSEGILINRIVTVDQLEALARHIRKNQK